MVYVWIVIAVVVIAALVAAVVLTRRKREQRIAQAGELRAVAQSRTGDVVATQQEVEVAAEDAAVAHRIADEADERLAEAERGLAQVEAHQEDVLREADRLDPKRRSDALETPPVETVSTGSHRKDV